MDGLTAFGLVAVTAMLVFYWLENRSVHFVLAFAVACAMGSAYGFLQGAWPFGVVEAVWSVVALRRWWLAKQTSPRQAGRVKAKQYKANPGPEKSEPIKLTVEPER
jgi:hypothetical protein